MKKEGSVRSGAVVPAWGVALAAASARTLVGLLGVALTEVDLADLGFALVNALDLVLVLAADLDMALVIAVGAAMEEAGMGKTVVGGATGCHWTSSASAELEYSASSIVAN